MRIKLSKDIVRLCAIIAVAAIVSGCDSDPPPGNVQYVHSSAVLAAPECGETTAAGALGQVVLLPECIQWSYEDSLLSLTHLQAVYNCCLDSIEVEMAVGEQTILIVESEYPEGGQGCRCTCRYDLEYQMVIVSAGSYVLHLRSNSQYEGLQELFEISLDLVATPSGTFCLDD